MKQQQKSPAPENVFSSEVDWNFDAVPEDQLQVCCLWEFARESVFMRSIRERSEEAERQQLESLDRMEFVQRDFMRAFSALGRRAILFQKGIYGFGGKQSCPGFVSAFPSPWQKLSQFERQVLMETAAWSAEKEYGFPGFRRSPYPSVRALEELFRPIASKTPVPAKDQAPVFSGFLRSAEKFEPNYPSLVCQSGREILAVEIDWGRHTNEQLVKEFANWLKKNEPSGVARPDGRGRNKEGDGRANLTRLAAMRLLSRFTALELVAEDKFPAIWKTKQFAGRKWGDVTKWHDARREAGKLFHSLFPFLARDEKPLSWHRQAPAK